MHLDGVPTPITLTVGAPFEGGYFAQVSNWPGPVFIIHPDLVGDMLRDPQNRHTFLKAWKEDMRALLAEGEQAERDLAAARAQVTDLCAERDGAVAIGSQLERKIAAARAEAARLRDSLAEACDLAEEGWAYAGEYLNEKWDTKNQIAGLRAALAPETQPDATPETK